MHNLNTVIKFEILKQIRKPLFWIAIFAFPVIMLVFGGVSFLSTKMAIDQGGKNQSQASQSVKKILVVDRSKLITKEAFKPIEIEMLEQSDEQAIASLKQSDAQALVIYPENPDQVTTQVFIKYHESSSSTQQLGDGVSRFASLAMKNSIGKDVDPKISAILKLDSLPISSSILDEQGKVYNPFARMVAPGVFLVIFFVIFTVTGNQMLVATTEEKENRVAEMILTTVQTKTLIIGKIIALTILGFIQIIALLLPLIIMYLVAVNYLDLPPVLNSLFSNIQFEFWPTFFGASLLVFGFLLTTGLIVLIGSLFPTAQDASQFFTPIILSMLVPFYFIQAILSGVESPIVTFMSYFPFSAPITLLIRNMAGSLSVQEGLIGLTLVIIFTLLAMLLAVRAFRQGAFEYSKKTSIKSLFK